jgi:hypothetical protein
MWKWRRKRMIRRLALTLAVAAVAAPAAQARIDENGASAGVAAVRPDDRAARFSPTGSVELIAVRPDDRAARFSPTGSVELVAVRPDDRAARFAPTGSVELVVVRPDGLDWGDVGIGAGSLFGLILVATGAAAAVRHVGRSATA